VATGQKTLVKSHLALAVATGIVWLPLGLLFRANYVLTGCEYSEPSGVISHGMQTLGGWTLFEYTVTTIGLLVLVRAHPPSLLDHERGLRTVVKVALIASIVVVVSAVIKPQDWGYVCDGE
jgi:hypothetical protein